jgi:hypothetical protein
MSIFFSWVKRKNYSRSAWLDEVSAYAGAPSLVANGRLLEWIEQAGPGVRKIIDIACDDGYATFQAAACSTISCTRDTPFQVSRASR